MATQRENEKRISESVAELARIKAERRAASENGAARDDAYAALVAAGIDIDHHESDLYAVDIPEARAILDGLGMKYRPFTGSHGGRWVEVPFAYTPFWDAKVARQATEQGAARDVGGWTPGPWTLEAGRSIHTSSGDFHLSYGKDPKTGAPHFTNFCELDRNAHLIAAAPELYAALELCAAWMDQPTGPAAFAEIRHRARLALAKARKGGGE